MIWIDSFLSPHFLQKDIGKTSQSTPGCLHESVLSGGEHSNVIFILIFLEKKGYLSFFGALQQIFFFFKKDGKTVKGIEIRIQTLIVRGKKIKRFI